MTTAQSAAPAAPKQRQKCTRQRKRYTHTPSRAVDTPTRFRAASAFAVPVGAARPFGSPVPPRRRRAVAAAQHTRRGGAGRVVRPPRVVAIPRATRHVPAARDANPPRDAYPPRRPPREESKDDDVVARNPIEARLLARERERKAKKPLTAKDLDNKMAEAEERRQLELEAIKFKGAQFSRPAPGPRRTVDYGEEKDSHK